MKYVHPKPKKWINEVVRKSSSDIRFVHSLSERYPSFKYRYTEKNMAHKSLMRFHKRVYHQNRIKESENLTKESWEVVSEMNGLKPSKIENVTISENGFRIADSEMVANMFNCFFREVL